MICPNCSENIIPISQITVDDDVYYVKPEIRTGECRGCAFKNEYNHQACLACKDGNIFVNGETNDSK